MYQSKPDLAKCQTVHNLSLALFCWAIETFDLQKLYFRKSTLNDEQSPHSTQLNRSTHFTPLIHLTEKACFHFDILAHFKESRNILSSSKCNKWLIYSSLGVGFSWRRGLFGGQNLGGNFWNGQFTLTRVYKSFILIVIQSKDKVKLCSLIWYTLLL